MPSPFEPSDRNRPVGGVAKINRPPTRGHAALTDLAIIIARIDHNYLPGAGHTAEINLDAAVTLYKKHEILIILCAQAVPGAVADADRIDHHVEHEAVFRPEIPEAAEGALQTVRMIATATVLAERAVAVKSYGKMPEKTAHAPGQLLPPNQSPAAVFI